MPEVLSSRALNRATLARQMLLARAPVTAADAVSRLAGMQAQLARPPFVGLWSRVDGFAREHLAMAAERREVVRATLMRGTIHLVTRDDYARFRPAVQPALTAGMHAILKDRLAGIDVAALLAAAREVFADTPCTFARLRERLAERFPSLDERAMGYAVRMQLPLVQVPRAGQAWAWPGTADFALADDWIGEPVATDGESETLALRYFAAFGPATAKDFQTWSYLPDAPAIVAGLRPRLAAFRDEKGREHLDLPTAPRPGEDVPAPVRFLPEYDNLLLAHAERTRLVSDAHRWPPRTWCSPRPSWSRAPSPAPGASSRRDAPPRWPSCRSSRSRRPRAPRSRRRASACSPSSSRSAPPAPSRWAPSATDTGTGRGTSVGSST
jgi:hypothetical protein